jgi:hypothetical protein
MAHAPDEPALPLGVNLAGYLDTTAGVGEAARHVLEALRAAGIAVAPLALSSRDVPREGAAGEAVHPVTIVCANPDGMTGARDELGPSAFEGRHVIGMWWWEVAALPQRWLRAFDLVDEVWVGSRFVADLLAAVSPVPVVHVPLALPEPVASAAGRAQLGLPAGFLFGFVYDYASVAARKNPLGLIDAFARAFPPGIGSEAGPSLVLKTLGGERHELEHAAVLAAAADHPRITVLDGRLSAADKNALIRELDCYVSLHRSEGFGLTIAEAMALGTPVIATDYGGTRDLLTAFNSLLVDHRPIAIGPGNDPYPEHGEWAEPDLDQAASLMRAAAADPEAGRARAQRARADVLARHAPAAAGSVMAGRLARVLTLPVDGRGHAEALDLGGVRARMATGPQAAPGADRGARGAVRDAALRAMRPYTVHQRLVDEELLRALQTIDERVRGLAAGQQALAAELARLRREVEE